MQHVVDVDVVQEPSTAPYETRVLFFATIDQIQLAVA